MTTIVPSSNVSVKLKELQNFLFMHHLITPSPFPLNLTNLSKKKITRPSRKQISLTYPPVITLNNYSILKGNFLLSSEERFPCQCDNEFQHLIPLISSGCILGKTTSAENSLRDLPSSETFSFKNYSLAAYEIHSDETENFWMNMSWRKIWEVKKSKI
ncbi:MAG: hypothetical protein JEY91_07310 [Spirochaetaceae bacterium]|nr:hypothetical protein [Spirochaetaceae bacterium]